VAHERSGRNTRRAPVVSRRGTLIILAGIVANLHLYFQPTSLFDTLLMLGLLAGGLGLIARSLRPQGPATARDDTWAS